MIKSELSSSHIPLILLTALSDEAHFLKGIESGAEVYLTKPFDQQTLLLQIKRLLKGRKLLRQHYQQQLQATTTTTSATPNSTSSNPLDEIFLEQLLQKIEANLDRKELSTESLSKDLRVHRRTLYRKVKNLLSNCTKENVQLNWSD